MNSPLCVPIIDSGPYWQAQGVRLRWAATSSGLRWPPATSAGIPGHVLRLAAAPAGLLPHVSLSPWVWHTARQLAMQSVIVSDFVIYINHAIWERLTTEFLNNLLYCKI